MKVISSKIGIPTRSASGLEIAPSCRFGFAGDLPDCKRSTAAASNSIPETADPSDREALIHLKGHRGNHCKLPRMMFPTA
ncbi:MAG: hypothetical protein ACKODG_10250, partial [Betaproteobacteria bacterium]